MRFSDAIGQPFSRSRSMIALSIATASRLAIVGFLDGKLSETTGFSMQTRGFCPKMEIENAHPFPCPARLSGSWRCHQPGEAHRRPDSQDTEAHQDGRQTG